MRMPLFFPPAKIKRRVDRRGAVPLRDLISQSGATCRASGAWVKRLVSVVRDGVFIEKEPGDWTPVRIGVPAGLSDRDAARFAVAAMAYGVMDLVARESIRGEPWASPSMPAGRPRSGTAKSASARQRAYRARRVALGRVDPTDATR
jgi:hypothetical protein